MDKCPNGCGIQVDETTHICGVCGQRFTERILLEFSQGNTTPV